MKYFKKNFLICFVITVFIGFAFLININLLNNRSLEIITLLITESKNHEWTAKIESVMYENGKYLEVSLQKKSSISLREVIYSAPAEFSDVSIEWEGDNFLIISDNSTGLTKAFKNIHMTVKTVYKTSRGRVGS